MNDSQRKHLERLLGKSAMPAFDPFRVDMPLTVFGMDVIESPDIPRYTLPPEVIPGVEWPAGFRESINAWSRAFLGTTNTVPPGVCLVIADRMVVMRPEDVVRVSNISI